LLKAAVERLGSERVIVAPSCSLLHVPQDLDSEIHLAPALKTWLSFAQAKLSELVSLANGDEAALDANQAAFADRKAAETTTNKTVRATLSGLGDEDFRWTSVYAQRTILQREELGLPLFPTTIIGSFPQTAEVRKHRAARRNGHETAGAYEAFLEQAIGDCIREQERIGLDVLVHGEFERNDMVE
jgi:5-methyltetrahydropteroyltriglutamate--homocysteine methyltransferase